MKKRWLTLLLAGSIVGVMAYGAAGSAAWFTDQATIPNSTATAGRIDIQTTQEGTTHPFTISNLMPGEWTSEFNLGVYNTSTSTVPVKYRITTGGVSETIGGFYNEIIVRAAHTHAGTLPADWCNNPTFVAYEGPLSGLTVNSVDDAISDSLGVNNTHVWKVCFGLPSTTTNTYQGAGASFNIVVDATQVTNPGWSQ